MSAISPTAGADFSVSPGEASQIPLTEDEQRMVAKLLGDPTYFPVEFRRWLEDFLGNSNFKVNKSQIVGGSGGGAAGNPTLLPAGIILPFAGSTYGKDCLPCNGAQVSRDTYPELFDAIGVSWGSAAAGNFRVPDLRDRALYGIGSVISLALTDGKDVGNRGGPYHYHQVSGNTVARGGHSHSVSVQSGGSHQHNYLYAGSTSIQQGTQGTYVGVSGNTLNSQNATGAGGDHSHSASAGSVPDHNHPIDLATTGGYDIDKPSFAGIQYVITTGKADASPTA